jgi:hypothetical protein
MGLQAAVHLVHMPWALTKEEEEELCRVIILCNPSCLPLPIGSLMALTLSAQPTAHIRSTTAAGKETRCQIKQRSSAPPARYHFYLHLNHTK